MAGPSTIQPSADSPPLEGPGREWIVDALGCDPAALADPGPLQELFDDLVAELELRVVGAPLWHRFPGPGGVTGLCLLAESHLTIHTFPEHGSLCLNLFCCRPRPAWDFARELRHRFGAGSVRVRILERDYVPALPAGAP